MERTIRSLTRHYPRRDETVLQVLAVLDRFQGVLNPEQSDFTYDDGRVELLLSLTGVLPIPIQANTYHCPIVFWLPLDFPSTPPIVFILPSETLAVRKGKNVDAGGRVNVQYLEQWSKKSEGCSLLSLIEELIPIFSARYPVTTIQPKAPARPSPPTSTSSTAQTSVAVSPAIQQSAPPRPPLPTNPSPSMSRSTADQPVSQPPPRPPLPGQNFVDGRPASVSGAESIRRPISHSEMSMNGAPPRPPPPPGSFELNRSPNLPPGPPPGYHPPPNSNSIPPYNVPQRSATTASFVSNAPRPPPIPGPFPRDSQSPLPPQPPIPQGPTHLPLGASMPPQMPNDPNRRYSSIPTSQPPQPPLPLPGTFSPPPVDLAGNRQDSLPSRPYGSLPPRPVSPAPSTSRAYSPTSSSVAAPPSTSFSSPRAPRQPDFRHDSHQRQGSYDSHQFRDPNRYSREYADSTRTYSPTPSTVMPPSTPPQSQFQRSRPQIPPVELPVRPYSPGLSSAATSLPPSARPPQPPTLNTRSPPTNNRAQWSHQHSSAATAASPSDYNAEYGSYAPPALSSTAVSQVGEEEYQTRRLDETVAQTERLSISRDQSNQAPRSPYEPYQPAPHSVDPRFPHPPRPPSAVFEPVVEPRAARQLQSQIGSSIESSSQYSSSYYPPSQQPVQPRQISYAQSPVPISQQVMRNPIRKPAFPPPPSSTTTTSINILDAADDELDSASSNNGPGSPTSVSTRGGGQTQTAQTQVPPPIPPNPALLALRQRLHSKLSTALSNLHTETTQQHLEPLSLMHSDLQKAVPAIEDEMARLRAVRDVCLNVRDRYQQVVEEGEKRMAEYEKKGEGVDVDEIVCGSTVVYTQLLDLVAEDSALEDTIYALGRGLNSGTANIDLDQFLKRVRALAREQFIKRATINKILLGLAIRRERNQQRERERSNNTVDIGNSRNGSGRGTPVVG
ncbi:hypothetical protein JCM3765_004428 [Sporobolomyces pararoseus]